MSKSIIFSILFLLSFSLIISVYGQEDLSFIETDKASYISGDTIEVNGKITGINNFSSIMVTNPTGDLVLIFFPIVDVDYIFNATLKTDGPKWKIEGEYTIKFYLNNHNYKTTFTIDCTTEPDRCIIDPKYTPINLELLTDKETYHGLDTIKITGTTPDKENNFLLALSQNNINLASINVKTDNDNYFHYDLDLHFLANQGSGFNRYLADGNYTIRTINTSSHVEAQKIINIDNSINHTENPNPLNSTNYNEKFAPFHNISVRSYDDNPKYLIGKIPLKKFNVNCSSLPDECKIMPDDQYVNQIIFSTDKTSYYVGDTITLTGKALKNHIWNDFTIDITNPRNNLIDSMSILVYANGNFNGTINTDNFKLNGDYKITLYTPYTKEQLNQNFTYYNPNIVDIVKLKSDVQTSQTDIIKLQNDTIQMRSDIDTMYIEFSNAIESLQTQFDSLILTVISNTARIFGLEAEVEAHLYCGKPMSHYFVIHGTNATDILIGTDHDDLIFGDDGDDFIDGMDGNDCIFGEGGNDVIHGQDGNDTLNGGPGIDELYGDDGDDTCIDGKVLSSCETIINS